jgi:hypothetical protein
MALPRPHAFVSEARLGHWTEIGALLRDDERYRFAADHADGRHERDRRFGCERCDADRILAKYVR